VATGSHTQYGYNPTEGNYTCLRSKSHNYPENWRFQPSIRVRPGSRGRDHSCRSFNCPARATGTKTLNPFSTVHHLHSRVHSTFRHHTRESGSCRWQRAVRIWSRHCHHKSRFLPFFECINSESIAMQPYGVKALVPAEFWVAPTPALTRFMPGHDARIGVTDDGLNPNNINIQITPSHHPLRPTTTFAVPCCTSGSTTFNLEYSRLSSTVYDTGLSYSVSTSPLSLSYCHCIHPLRLYCYVMTHITA